MTPQPELRTSVMKRAGHSDFRVTRPYLDLAGVDFA